MRRIEAAHGSAIFDSYAFLDPQRAIKQIESALSIDLDDVNGLLDPNTLEDEIDAALEGGSTPEWVPANAKIYIDLIAPGRAWTEDNGEVAIDTLLGTDANTFNYWDTTEYNPSDLTSDGLVPSAHPPAFLGAALTKILVGATLVTHVKQIVSPSSSSVHPTIMMSADGNDAISSVYTPSVSREIDVNSHSGPLNLVIDPIVNGGMGAINVVAMTITASRFDLAVNGSSAIDSALLDADRPVANPIAAVLVDVGTAQFALQSITIYDALPSTAGLSALSETGVTNTAPHSLAWEWSGGTNGGTNGITNEYAPVDVTAGNTVLSFPASSPSAVDDQGNPLTWSVSGNGEIVVIGSTDITIATKAEGDGGVGLSTGGPYTFTVRATDPGGLYVEQQFTITVTA